MKGASMTEITVGSWVRTRVDHDIGEVVRVQPVYAPASRRYATSDNDRIYVRWGGTTSLPTIYCRKELRLVGE